MAKKRASKLWSLLAIFITFVALPLAQGQSTILHLKNGDRLSGKVLRESEQEVVLSNALLGEIKVPIAEIERREAVAQPEPPSAAPSEPKEEPTPPADPVTTREMEKKKEKEADAQKPVEPANPEAQSIAASPRFWQNRLDLGLNLRYSAKDQQEFLVLGKSTYTRPPFRQLFDLNFAYGRTDGVRSANRFTLTSKSEYQLRPKTYVFNLLGGGYDEIRKIDYQYEAGPGFGMELINSTKYKFVWKSEVGVNFQQQYRTDNTRKDNYSLRLAEIFAWRVWGKLTADAKVEFFPNLDALGEYRLRIESTLGYPLTDRLSLNLVFIDLYDTQPARGIAPNDLQIRSTIGIKF